MVGIWRYLYLLPLIVRIADMGKYEQIFSNFLLKPPESYVKITV